MPCTKTRKQIANAIRHSNKEVVLPFSARTDSDLKDVAALLFSTLAQSSHLHSVPHAIPALKHSQYFFLHCVFLQLQPFPAFSFLALVVFALIISCACAIQSSWCSSLIQSQQEHSDVQSFPVEKHSQYIFKHFVFLQMQPVFFFFIVDEDQTAMGGISYRRLASIDISESGMSSQFQRSSFFQLFRYIAGMYLFVSMKRRVWLKLGQEGAFRFCSLKKFYSLIFHAFFSKQYNHKSWQIKKDGLNELYTRPQYYKIRPTLTQIDFKQKHSHRLGFG